MAQQEAGTLTFIPTSKPEPIRLAFAAVRVKANRAVFTAKFHFQAVDKAEAAGYKFDDFEEGFVTEGGEFIEYGEVQRMLDVDPFSVVSKRFSND